MERYKNGINEEYGARPLKRAIEKYVSTPLAQKMLSEDAMEKSIIAITALKGKAKFNIENKIEDPPFYISDQYSEQIEANMGGVE